LFPRLLDSRAYGGREQFLYWALLQDSMPSPMPE
jgi:hypothetical protein